MDRGDQVASHLQEEKENLISNLNDPTSLKVLLADTHQCMKNNHGHSLENPSCNAVTGTGCSHSYETFMLMMYRANYS